MTASSKDEAATFLAKQCQEYRERAQLSMFALAKQAGVSVRMIVRMENPQQLGDAIKGSASSLRQCKALARVMVQIAEALSMSGKSWVKRAALPLDNRALDQVIRSGQTRQKAAAAGQTAIGDKTARALTKVRRAHKTDHQCTPIRIHGVLIPYGPFAQAQSKNDSFLQKLALSIIRSLDYHFDISWEPPKADYRAVLFQERAVSADLQIQIGFLTQVQRDFASADWRFESLPGFYIRTSFLSVPGKHLPSWRSILSGSSKEPIRIVFLKDSAADNLLRGVCCLDPNASSSRLPSGWEILPLEVKLDASEIACAVENEFSRPDKRAVFVADECTAEVLRRHLPKTDLVDLSSGDEELLPSYPLGIGVKASAASLSEFLRRILNQELFVHNAAVVATIYGEYLLKTFRANTEVSRTVLDQLKDGKERLSMPSYLRLRHGAKPLPGRFLQLVEQELEFGLGETYVLDTPLLKRLTAAFLPSHYSSPI